MKEERKNEILRYINENESASVQKLCKLFHASEATIRRDLTDLEENGQIRRVFGGATIASSGEKQIPLYVRERENRKEKERLAEKALPCIHDGDILFLDGSSTVEALARKLGRKKDIIVITNGLKTAEILADMKIKTYVTGGLTVNNSLTLVGKEAESFVSKYNAVTAFLSCKGMDAEKFTDTSERETALRSLMMKNASKTVMMMTKNKKDKTYLHTLCRKEEVDILLTEE